MGKTKKPAKSTKVDESVSVSDVASVIDDDNS